MRNIHRVQSILPHLAILALGVLLVWTLLLPGYLFTIDGVFGPASTHKAWIDHLRGVGPNLSLRGISPPVEVAYYGVAHALDASLLPAWTLQTLPLLALLTLAGIGTYHLSPALSGYSRFFAAALYMVNPFIYVRVLSGAFWFIWGYAFLPFLVKSVLDLFDKPGWRSAAKSGVWLAVIAPSPHFLAFSFVIIGALFISRLIARQLTANVIASLAGAGLMFAITNIGWLYSTVSGTGLGASDLGSVTQRDLSLFSAATGSHGLFDLAAMYGFWRGVFDYPKYHLPGWELMFLALLFLALAGIFWNWRGRNSLNVRVMTFLSVAGLVFASGIGYKWFGSVNLWLYKVFPAFGAFRDSQKFVALLILGYAYLGSLGLDVLRGSVAVFRNGRQFQLAVAAAGIGLVFLYTYTMFFGFSGQIQKTDYPQDYYQVRQYLARQPGKFNILFLPWHQSMKLSWTGFVVANPAQDIFDQPVISGDNIEMPGVYTESTNPVSTYVETGLGMRNSVTDFGKFVSPLGVRYILLAKEVDWRNYEFLLHQSDLVVVMDSPRLVLLENMSSSFVAGQPVPSEIDPSVANAVESQIQAYHSSKAWWGYVPTSIILILSVLAILVAPEKSR